MNRETKDKLTEAGVKVGATWFGKLMDRRAAKGGKLVLWWRRTFGRVTPEQIESATNDAIDVTKDLRKKKR